MSNESITIEKFIRDEYKDFMIYDNERSLPSAVDGLKTSQRKIIHTVFQTVKEGEAPKVANLGNSASNLTHYKHAEDSIIDAVIGLATDYAGANNYPLLEKKGQFGSVFDNEASSPRYIFVKRTKRLNEMFDSNDKEIINYKEFDGDKIEPEFFLPKLPLIAINGGEGIGNGYAWKALPRKPENVREYVRQYIQTGSADETLLIPWFNGFKGQVLQLDEKKFEVSGVIERVNTTTLVIRDLPPLPAYQYEKYKTKLLKFMVPQRKKPAFVSEFKNESNDKHGWEITLRVPREFTKKTDRDMLDDLSMITTVTENINVWGFDNTLKRFDSMKDLIHYWIEERLKWVETRKTYILRESVERADWLENFIKLIDHWRANPILAHKKKEDLLTHLFLISSKEEYVYRFLDQNILSLTEYRLANLRKEYEELTSFINEYGSKTPESIYLGDLETLSLK